MDLLIRGDRRRDRMSSSMTCEWSTTTCWSTPGSRSAPRPAATTTPLDWRFEAGGARVVTAPEPVRGGARAVALEGIPSDFRQVTQEIRALTGATRYRITAWLRTDGISAAPTVSARFDTGSDQIVANETSDGTFRLVGRELAAPPGAERLTLQLRLAKGVSGTAYFDDLLVVPVA